MAVNKGNFAVCATQNGTYTEFKAKNIKQDWDSLATEDSGRDAAGGMHISWIKPLLRKWEIELPPCSSTEVYNLIRAVQGKIYYIQVFDLTTNSVQKVKVYTSNSSSDCYSGVISGGIYQGVAFSAIEVG